MQFYGALILFMTLSAACALRCYSCSGKGCTDQVTCPDVPLIPLDRCAVTETSGQVAKTCMNSGLCRDPIKCCSTDLCNSATPTSSSATTTTSSAKSTGSSATPTGSSVLLLLVSSAIITLFL